MKKYFEHVCILFLVARHTKNTADQLFNLLKNDYRSHNVFSLTELIKVCNINQYVTAYKCVWTDFYDWNNFLTRIFMPKLEAAKKYQLFESCYNNKATVKCILSGLLDRVIYDNDLSRINPTMTANAQQKVVLLQPNKVYKKRLGLRDIKAVGVKENYAELIDKESEYHKEVYSMPSLDIWIKVMNWYPLGTRIEREFVKDSGIINDATFTDIDLETKRYKLKWNDEDEFLEKKDNNTSG